MPKRIDWLPYGVNERAVALGGIANGAESYGAGLGLTPAQIDRIKAIADEYAFAARIYEVNKNNLKALRTWRDSVMSNTRPIKPIQERPMFDLPNHVKKPLRELKPQLKVTAVEGFKVRIACEMEGMTAVQIEFRRKGEEKWEKVAFLTKLPETIFIEPRVMGVPETGLMRAIFIKNNKIVGQYSNMPTVTIFGM